MSSIKSFFDNTFFMNGTEGTILFVICVAAAVLTIAAIALAIAVAVAVGRHKMESASEVATPAGKIAPPTAQAEPTQTEQAAPEQAEKAAPTQAEQTEVMQAPADGEHAEVPAEQAGQAQAEQAGAVSEQEKSPKIHAELSAETAAFLEDGGTIYNRSFTARLIQSSDEVKEWYARLKNELLSYKKVKARMSWKRESFRVGRNIVARLGYRGNTLCIYLPLAPADYEGSKYKIEDVSEYAFFADVPCMYRVKNELRVRYSAELIAAVTSKLGVERVEREAEDLYLPYEDTETLIQKGLIKLREGAERETAPKQDNAEEAAAELLKDKPEEEIEESHVGESVEENVEETNKIAEDSAEENVSAAENCSEEELAPDTEETEREAEEPEKENERGAAVEEEEKSVEEPAVEEPSEEKEGAEESASRQESDPPQAEARGSSAQEPVDASPVEEEEDGIDVVGVMFRRNGKKVYWFDPDGKTWEKGEIALYLSPAMPPQEVIVVERAKLPPSKLHLPLKPLCKGTIGTV